MINHFSKRFSTGFFHRLLKNAAADENYSFFRGDDFLAFKGYTRFESGNRVYFFIFLPVDKCVRNLQIYRRIEKAEYADRA